MNPIRVLEPTRELLADMVRPRDPDVVSLLVPLLPLEEARITLRNLGRDARDVLDAVGRSGDGRRVVALVEAALDDHGLWVGPSAGLGLFIADEQATVILRPSAVPQVVVGPRFQVKHLLGTTAGASFAVLALSATATHLYLGGGGSFREVTTQGFPVVKADVLRFDDREPQLVSHGSARRGAGAVVASFHGQGDSGQDEDHRRYLRAVAAAVDGVLRGQPLVLAGTGEIVADYRSFGAYAQMVDEALPGSGERWEIPELREAAHAVLENGHNREAAARLGEVASLVETGMAVSDPGEVLAAACDGRVQTVVVAGDEELWGTYDATVRRIACLGDAEDGEDLLNVAACETWAHGGDVHVIPEAEVPGSWPVAAVLRY